MQNQNSVLSETVSFLRFPLIVGVVLIHTNLGNFEIGGVKCVDLEAFPMSKFIEHLVACEFAAISVPLFFLFSGYFFFADSEFSWAKYGDKLRKRVRTLLIPYVFWNLLIVFKIFLSQKFLASMSTYGMKQVADYELTDWLNVFWNFCDGFPADMPLWYVRDLMLLCLFAPVVYFLLKKTRVWCVLTLLLLFVLGWLPKFGIFSNTPFFFFVGAWFGMEKIDFTRMLRPFLRPLLCVYPLLVACSMLCFYDVISSEFLEGVFNRAGICSGMALAVSFAAYCVENGRARMSGLLTGSVFFIYASHMLFNRLFLKGLVKLCSPMTDVVACCTYFVNSVIVLAVCLCAYMLLRRVCPKFLALITGGRF